MAISLVGYSSSITASSGSTLLSMPSGIQIGDAILLMSASVTTGLLVRPTDYLQLAYAGTNPAMGVYFKIATATEPSTILLTNTTGTTTVGAAAYVFRASVGEIAVATAIQTAGTGTTLQYNGITGLSAAGGWLDQWYGAFGCTNNDTLAIETVPAPSPFVYKEKQSAPGLAFALFDSNGPVVGSNLATSTANLGTSNNWRTTTFRVAEFPHPPYSSGGVFNPLNHPLIN